jgi:hypothetical protein
MNESALVEMLDGIEAYEAAMNNTTISESVAPVIVCPDHFVRELLFFRSKVPRSVRKQDGHMCMRCLLGRHEDCAVKNCPCIHRLMEAEAKLATSLVG